MENNHDSFRFTYSPQQQAEIEKIRSKYLPKEEDKMALLRRLHASASRKAQGWAITLGVVGALILGTGMSLFLTDLGASLGPLSMVLGVGVGVAGLILVGLAYPIYNTILKKERTRIAPQILQLTEELLNTGK